MTDGLFLVADVAGHGLLIDATRVDSVVEIGEVADAPGAAPAVRGLAALRSRIATVVDARRLLDLAEDRDEPCRRQERAVITSVDGHVYALVVDALADVAPFTVEPPPAGMTFDGGWTAVTGVAERNGKTLLALDLDRLLQRCAA